MESPSTWFVSHKIKVIAWNALTNTTSSHSSGVIAGGTWEHPRQNSSLLWRMNDLNFEYLNALQEEFRDYETNLNAKIGKLHDPLLLATHPVESGGFVSDLQWIPFAPEQLLVSTSNGSLEHISTKNLEANLGIDMFEDPDALEEITVSLKTESLWQRLHTGSATSIDIQKDIQLVTSVGEDGCLHLIALEEKNPVFTYKNADSMAMNIVKFIGIQQIVTGSYQLKLWDIRAPYAVLENKTIKQSARSHEQDHNSQIGREISSIAIHPTIPHLFATGYSSGSIAVWDLRIPDRTLYSIKAHDYDAFHPSEPSILLSCSWEGSLMLWDFAKTFSNTEYNSSQGKVSHTELIRNEQSINSFDVSQQLKTIVCGTDDDAIITKKLAF